MSIEAARFLPSKRTAIAVLIVAVGVSLLAWLYAKPVAVGAHTASTQVVVAEVMGTGTLEARVSTTIASKIAGRIETIVVDQGERVEANHVLVNLDGADIRRQVEVARADRAAAEAAVGRSRADKVKSQAILTAARREYDRIRELVRKGVMSQVEVDKAQDAVRIAAAGLGAASSAVTEAVRRQTASARSLEFQEARLAETVIRAPFAGLITRRHREPGDVLVPGSPIFSLIATDELWVSAWVDETEMGRLADGQKARIVFRSKPAREFSGTVARLGREVDRETREFVVDVRVKDLPKNWAIGQRAEVFVEVDRSTDALAVPARLVRRRADATGVFVHSDGRAHWRAVKLGLQGRGVVEVKDGLQAGEAVLERSDGRPLRDGGRVAMP